MQWQELGYLASFLGPVGSALLATNKSYRWTGFLFHGIGSICWLGYAIINGITPLIISGVAFIIIESFGAYRHKNGIGEKVE